MQKQMDVDNLLAALVSSGIIGGGSQPNEEQSIEEDNKVVEKKEECGAERDNTYDPVSSQVLLIFLHTMSATI